MCDADGTKEKADFTYWVTTRTDRYLNRIIIIHENWTNITLQPRRYKKITTNSARSSTGPIGLKAERKPYFLKEWQANVNNPKKLVLQQQLGTQNSVYQIL